MAVTDIIGFSFFNIVSYNKDHTFPRSQQSAVTSTLIAPESQTTTPHARCSARLIDVQLARLLGRSPARLDYFLASHCKKKTRRQAKKKE
jgi:hypothetical protein